jgi:hypothetical protein
LAGDELATDDWVFEQMGQHSMFNPYREKRRV